MKIIEQSHEILSYTDIGILERAGRTCYQSQEKIGCNGPWIKDTSLIEPACYAYYADPCKRIDCEHHSSHKFVKTLIKNGHHAMLEFGDITVKFITNRGVSHELVRHRLCSFAQESTRYVKYGGEMEFIKPVWIAQEICGVRNAPVNYGTSLEAWLYVMGVAEKAYQTILSKEYTEWDNWKAQQAREILPNSLKTEIIVKANFREWMHILKLRCAKAAHPQMRALMLPLLEELKTKIPVIFEDIV